MTRDKWADNPLVDLAPERLRAAMEDGGWTDASLAAAVSRQARPRHKLERQNVRHLATQEGKRTRCRAWRRAALAGVLGVSELWLSGEDILLPLIPQLRLQRLGHTSPRVALALQRLLIECRDACERDLAARAYVEVEDPSTVDPGHLVVGVLLESLAQLATPAMWQARLGAPAPHAPPSGDADAHATEDDAALGLIAAWRLILAPWRVQRVPLQYGALGDLARWLSPLMHMEPDADLPDTVEHRVARRRKIVRDPLHPLALIQWPLRRTPTSLSEG